MVFSSLLFVFLFFIANIIVQALCEDIRTKNVVMLVFSLVFYSWAGVRYVFLLLGMTFICWFGALLVAGSETPRSKKAFLAGTVTLVLLILGIFKYTGFFLSNFKLIFGVPEAIPQIALPIGISFYTFQLLSYVVDVYRGDAAVQRKYWLLLLYASLFHQCIAGPIVRYRDINNDILYRKTKPREIGAGISRFAVGLAKKAILANGCAAVADELLAVGTLGQTSVLGMWLGVLAYTLQIYLDFSAYSDMAIGMGLMCGFHYKENFDYPYIADSVTDFWRRWHISLGTFFRDYVYIPLGGNRCSKSRHIFNMLVVWALTGMWHGASWNFILWGMYFFVFLVLEKYVFDPKKIPAVLRHIGLLLVVMFGWVLFRFPEMSNMGTCLAGMFGINGNPFADLSTALVFRNNVFFLIFACVASTPVIKTAGQILRYLSSKSMGLLKAYSVLDAALPTVLVFLSAFALAGNSYNPFLYFRF